MQLKMGSRQPTEMASSSELTAPADSQNTMFSTIRKFFTYRKTQSSANSTATSAANSIISTPVLSPVTDDSVATLDLDLPLPLDGSFIDEAFNQYRCSKIRPSQARKRPQIPQEWTSHEERQLSNLGVTGLLPEGFHPVRAASSASNVSNAPSLASASSGDSISLCSDFGNNTPRSSTGNSTSSPIIYSGRAGGSSESSRQSRTSLSEGFASTPKTISRASFQTIGSDRPRVSFSIDTFSPSSARSSINAFSQSRPESRASARQVRGDLPSRSWAEEVDSEGAPLIPAKSLLRSWSSRSGSTLSLQQAQDRIREETEEEEEARDEVPALLSEPGSLKVEGNRFSMGREMSSRHCGNSFRLSNDCRRRRSYGGATVRPINGQHPSKHWFDRDELTGKPVGAMESKSGLALRLAQAIGEPSGAWKESGTTWMKLSDIRSGTVKARKSASVCL